MVYITYAPNVPKFTVFFVKTVAEGSCKALFSHHN